MPDDPHDRSDGLRPEFWKRYPLESLPRNEWEALCDGCAKCCLIKLEDEDDWFYAPRWRRTRKSRCSKGSR